MKPDRRLRRDKADPAQDFWHTLRIGAVIACALFVLLPPLLG